LGGVVIVEIIKGKRKNKQNLKYGFIEPSWNPIVGCTHECSYCWAKTLHNANRNKTYFKGFGEPELVFKNLGPKKMIEDLDKKPEKSWVFVCVMGDLFCKNDVIKRKDIQWVLKTMKFRSDLDYLLVTKNPKGFASFVGQFPDNCYLGTTIETNRNEIIKKYSKAPLPYFRYKAMKNLQHKKKFLALEPLLDFDVKILSKWIVEMNPEIIAIGFDEHPRSNEENQS
jgi:DNA repair photolyase